MHLHHEEDRSGHGTLNPTRRTLLGWLGSLPFAGWLGLAKPEPFVPMYSKYWTDPNHWFLVPQRSVQIIDKNWRFTNLPTGPWLTVESLEAARQMMLNERS